MSDAQAAQGTIAPATTAPATAQAQPAQVDPDTEPKDFPKWFGPRVEQAKRSATNEILKTLGVESVDAAKAAVEAAKKLETKLHEILHSEDHKWYIGKMDPEEAARRKGAAQEFKKRYE